MAVRRVMYELKKFVGKGPVNENYIGITNDPTMTGAGADDLTSLTAFIVGPHDTPYSGGFFNFSVKIPPNYPSAPPTVKITTTDDGRVRYNPNLYSGGKVCMDILNNHANNSWNPGMGLEQILLSTQSLMCEDPYHNEPGFEDCDAGMSPDRKTVRNPGAVCRAYEAKIRHEVLRHAVCDVLEQHKIAAFWWPSAVARFMKDVDNHIAVCDKMASVWDGKTFMVARFEGPGNETAGKFNFSAIRARLLALKQHLASSPDFVASPAAAEEPTAPPQPPAEEPTKVAEPPAAQPTAAAAPPETAAPSSTYPFEGPQTDVGDLAMAALEELTESADASVRDAYELLITSVALCLMDEPMVNPVGSSLPPHAAALATALGFEQAQTEDGIMWILDSKKASRDAFEFVQGLMSDALE